MEPSTNQNRDLLGSTWWMWVRRILGVVLHLEHCSEWTGLSQRIPRLRVGAYSSISAISDTRSACHVDFFQWLPWQCSWAEPIYLQSGSKCRDRENILHQRADLYWFRLA